MALSAASSGISTMETEIDSIGDNVANADTDGYQETDPEFEDILTQQLTPASSASGTGVDALASTNPSAIGAGAEVAGMQTNFAQGATQQTGVASNAAIEGSGFFVIDQGGDTYYTDAGDFQLDSNGTLATQNGGTVQGWTGNQPTTGPTGPITIPTGETIAPQETANVTIGGNIPSGAAAFTTTATMFDAQGNEVPLTLTYTPTGTPNQWTMQASVNGTNLFAAGITLTFNPSGQLASYSVDGGATTPATGATSIATTEALPAGFDWNEASINFDLPANGASTALTQYSTDQTVAATPDGSEQGTLTSYSIGQNGVITGSFSNGATEQLATIAIATFSNPEGLGNLGNLEYQSTAASGKAVIGTPGTNGSGTLIGGALAQSNVDLATDLTDLIEAQTDYEADTKVISTDQEALQSLVTNA
jgi:flagellar hook protein FlgE